MPDERHHPAAIGLVVDTTDPSNTTPCSDFIALQTSALRRRVTDFADPRTYRCRTEHNRLHPAGSVRPGGTYERTGTDMARGGSNVLLSFETIADRMEVPKRTVLDNYRTWNIPIVRISDRILRIRERDFEAWLDARTE
jgi:hypothetical protein